MRYLTSAILAWLIALFATTAPAQTLTASTVTRPPFSMPSDDGGHTGFSIDLLRAIAEELGRDLQIDRAPSFAAMLDATRTGAVDLAIANISITAAREAEMDFSQPIFESGLQIMVPFETSGQASIWRALLSLDLLAAIGIAFVLLLGGGMIMWIFERRAQPYFDRPMKEAWFPSFWWALNLVVNGGFEERVPRSFVGRIFGTLLVVSSLFVVSVFVARITASMTVAALNGSVNSVNDLYGHPVATIDGSTAAAFLERRELDYRGFADLGDLLAAFEDGSAWAIVFDAPILSHYVSGVGDGIGELAGPVFLRENYGIALPSGSPLAEDINQVLLTLRENGTYDRIHRKWFGQSS